MKNWLRIIVIMGLLLTGSACLGSGGAETPAATTVPPVQATPEVRLGAVQRVEEGGFSFLRVPDYDLDIFGGFVEMLAPGAEPYIGPSIVLFGDSRAAMTAEEMMEGFRSEEAAGDAWQQMGDNQTVLIAGLPGLAADFSMLRGTVTFKGRVYVLVVTPMQQFVMLVGGPESAWAELEPLAEAVLASVEFFEPVTPTPTSFMEPGWYPYTNPNAARDVVVYDGLIYAAALGGEDGQMFVVGRGGTFYAERAGRLYLRINDDILSDNEGYVTVEVSVTPSTSR